MSDREILARLEAANAAEFSELLSRPTADEARLYRAYFGSERYEELRGKTLRGSRAKRAPKRGNVVILHGIMGGELTVFDDGRPRHVWLNIIQILFGGVDRLRMADGKSVFDVRATGILKKWYAEQILDLSADWNTQVYWYDWRCDIDETADNLRAKIDGWFGDTAAVNLVAHSMGGLVSRTYIARHPARWKKGGKLVMLGTPNHGSFAIPQVITGVIDTVRKLERLDIKHNRAQFTEILAGLPGSLQMLPSPLVMPTMDALYRTGTWGGRVPQILLDRARRHHDFLAGVVDGTRMHYIAGCNRRTYDDILRWDRLDALEGYGASMSGDGTVPHRLGFLEQNGKRIPTWFVEEDHGALPNNSAAINAVERLLLNDKCDLPTVPTGARSAAANRAALQAAEMAGRNGDERKLGEIAARLRSGRRAGAEADDANVSHDEIEAAEIVLRSFLAGKPARQGPADLRSSLQASKADTRTSPSVTIELVLGDLTNLRPEAKGVAPVDAVSVGHYIGVTPQNAELALDRALSGWRKGDSEDKLVITALHKRGSLPAQLGQIFVLPNLLKPGQLAVLAGMGEPGTFGTPQLTVAVRELAWAMGKLQRRNLASVLIGAGVGNLSVSAAVRAWLRGLRRALYEAHAAKAPKLEQITFVELSPEIFVQIHQALQIESKLIGPNGDPEPLHVKYDPPSEKDLEAVKMAAKRRASMRARSAIEREFASGGSTNGGAQASTETVRFTVRLNDGTYEFSLLSREAAIPQRDVKVDPSLIDQINDEIPAASNSESQRDLGNLLGRMLIPTEIRGNVIKPDVPTVLAVDATTARIHFEIAALSPSAGSGFDPAAFIGTSANLTRQLRTTFAPLPEPPIVTGRTLRVLVIADPCEESPLPGAQEEGEAVANLFDQYKSSGAKVEVVRLFGPRDATRVAVLGRLVNERFDLVHYAGHCYFNPENPSASGWLFSGKKVLSASELDRIDRIPRFAFSNACESGVTPDRADKRKAGMAPSFAEVFFSRGVSNFICTAWPVDDTAALTFATRVYNGLLGMLPTGAEPLHAAIRAARIEIANLGDGGRATWGAYQHYGDPFFRISAS